MGQILIVDDDPSSRELLEKRLKKQEHETLVASNGKEALQLLQEKKCDLVLLDIKMPLLSGYDVLQVMHEQEDLSTIPVIVISAIEEMESVIRCIELGAADYLTKPFNPVLLKARVETCLEKKRYLDQLEKERKKVDELLHVIFPGPIADELEQTAAVAPRLYEKAAILFCDVADFTLYCNQHTPQEVLASLQELVEHFESLSIQHHIQKIKTSGDAFIGAAGLLSFSENPVLDCVACGLKMVKIAPTLRAKWEVRVGVHIGPVMAGVVGHRQYCFDIWGDTVNIAARLAEQGSIGGVTLTQEALGELNGFYDTVSLGKYPIKGKGNTELFRVANRNRVGEGRRR
jgi:adenylate cyclase